MRRSGKKPTRRNQSRPSKTSIALQERKTAGKKSEHSGKTAQRTAPSGTHRLQDLSSIADKEAAVRAERIGEVKAQIAQGTYQVNLEAVAKAIVRSEIARLLSEEPGGKKRKA